MLKIACMSLSGGQGKTTTSVLLGKYLAAAGCTVLEIDADPQSNLTTFLGHDVAPSEPTLLEVFKGTVSLEEGIYPTPVENLFIIPSDDGLDGVQDYLSSSGVGAMLLKKRLDAAKDSFDVCVIDCPPQRSQICKSVIGAATQIVIPCEATVKGYGSLVRTLDAVKELSEIGASEAQVLGVIPFRDRWVGANQTQESRTCIEAMAQEVGSELMLPSIRESERYKQAISKGTTLAALGMPDLEYPFEVLLKRIRELIGKQP
jgi:chromosome partitioning protein